ncbi:MAG: hypothetical protein IKH07_06965 [Oscillospiraceae bacterium]|nr:hypothetical protein [Oscillospiraceae bacterium]
MTSLYGLGYHQRGVSTAFERTLKQHGIAACWSISSLPGELGGGTAGKRCGQKLHRNNQREAIPEGESPKKYTETPVGNDPTGVLFVPFCPFPGLSAFYPRMGQIWVKGLTHSLTQIVLK